MQSNVATSRYKLIEEEEVDDDDDDDDEEGCITGKEESILGALFLFFSLAVPRLSLSALSSFLRFSLLLGESLFESESIFTIAERGGESFPAFFDNESDAVLGEIEREEEEKEVEEVVEGARFCKLFVSIS